MIQTHSEDPDVELAANQALDIIQDILGKLPKATTFDYGGHTLQLNEFDVCMRCTSPIGEAQAAAQAIRARSDATSDETIREHLDLAAQFFQHEAEVAIVRAEFHNGLGTEKILNVLLGFQYDRKINDDYSHSHSKEA